MEPLANRILSDDPHVKSQISRYQGQVVRIEIEDLSLSIDLVPSPEGLMLMPSKTVKADVCLKGSSRAFLHLLNQSPNKGKSRFKDLKLEGDFELALGLSRAFSELHIDWENLLAKPLGQSAAHDVVNVGRQFKRFACDVVDKIGQDVRRSLQTGLEVCPHATAVDDFCQEVDALKLSVDRLEARLLHVKKEDV